MLERQRVVTARALAAESAGNNNAARMAIMAITTRSSINVNARLTVHQTPRIGMCYKLFRNAHPHLLIYMSARWQKETFIFGKYLDYLFGQQLVGTVRLRRPRRVERRNVARCSIMGVIVPPATVRARTAQARHPYQESP